MTHAESTDTWDRHLVIGEEITPGKVAVRVDRRFFSVSRTVSLLLQNLIDSKRPTELQLTVQAFKVRLSVQQSKQLAEQLVSFLEPEKRGEDFWRQVRRGFIKLPLVVPDDRFVAFFRSRVISVPSIVLFTSVSLITLLICALKAPGLPALSSFRSFPFGQLGLLWFMLTLTTMVHELGHAVVAAHYGVKTRAMGVALFLLQPAGFADVSNGWLSTARTRIMIALGGFIFQLLPLFLAACAWVVSGQAVFGYYCLSSIGIMILNLVPLARTDGYWILINFLNDPHLLPQANRQAIRAIRRPALFLRDDARQQTYAVFGLSSILYTAGMYLLGFGTLLTRLPEGFRRLSPLLFLIGVCGFLISRLVRWWLLRRATRTAFASD